MAVGLDGAASFVEMARADSGCEVWHQDFLALELPAARFDGIFANASLFHVPRAELPRVLRELHATLKPGGVLFCSNPRGDNEEGWNGGRYGVWHDLDAWRALVTAAGFAELEHYYRPPGLPREQQPWLATVWRRLGFCTRYMYQVHVPGTVQELDGADGRAVAMASVCRTATPQRTWE